MIKHGQLLLISHWWGSPQVPPHWSLQMVSEAGEIFVHTHIHERPNGDMQQQPCP